MYRWSDEFTCIAFTVGIQLMHSWIIPLLLFWISDALLLCSIFTYMLLPHLPALPFVPDCQPFSLSLSSSWTVQVNLMMYFALESIYKHLHNCVIGTYSPSASYMASLVCFITFHLCAFILTLNIAPSKHIAEMFQIMYEMCQGLEIGLSKYSLVVTWCCHVMTPWRYYIYF